MAVSFYDLTALFRIVVCVFTFIILQKRRKARESGQICTTGAEFAPLVVFFLFILMAFFNIPDYLFMLHSSIFEGFQMEIARNLKFAKQLEEERIAVNISGIKIYYLI